MGLLKLLFGKKVKNILEQAVDAAKDDKELQKAFGDLGYSTDKMELLALDFCRRHPDDKNCGDYKTGDYEKLLKKMCKKYPDDKELLKKLQEIS